ncbi:hypothetical protein AB0J13_29135 [Streptomyces anulatus]|uniref:hypothetical protein n=1 Tax=Streptomyces anulatus TaxID=1892 RepID=UPI0033C0A42E
MPSVRAAGPVRRAPPPGVAACALFDVPLGTALTRNAARSRVVDPHVVTELHQMLPTAEQLTAEGFGAVYRIPDGILDL